jgi:hypothetical protein
LLLLCALSAASACKDKPVTQPAAQLRAEEAKEVEAELARQPAVVVPVLAPEATPDRGASPSAAQLPVPEDFQAETATTIMRANYLNELDKLETEVRADEH